MHGRVEPHVLMQLWKALQKPVPSASERLSAQMLTRFLRDGWAALCDVEDFLFGMDERTDALRPEHLLEMFKLHSVPVYPKPRRASEAVYGYSAISLAEVAHLTIQVERLGFSVQPDAIVDAVRPLLSGRSLLTDSEMSVLWFKRNRHRCDDIQFQAAGDNPRRLRREVFKTSTEYTAEAWIDQDNMPWTLSVARPKRAKSRAMCAFG